MRELDSENSLTSPADHRIYIASAEGIAARVRSGGHDIPETDARRRFVRSWNNFQKHYKLLADDVHILDESGPNPIPLSK